MHQQQFGTPSIDNDTIDELLNDPQKSIDNSLKANDKSNGNFYVLPEVSISSDFIKSKVAVKISDLSVKSSIAVNSMTGTLDKQTWERFWQLYNLIQDHSVMLYLEKQ